MTYEQARSQAIEIIGENNPDDYIIQPTQHAEYLRQSAPALASILSRSDISERTKEYEKHDAKAQSYQRDFVGYSLLANKAVFFGSVFGVLVIVASAALAGWGFAHTFGVGLLGVGGVIAGAAANRWLHLVERRNLLKRWMQERAQAETERLEYFDQVTNAEAAALPSGSGVPLPLLQLEYFRRYHFDVQRSYYENRATDHEQLADKIIGREGWAVMLSSIGTGLGAGGAALVNPNWAPLAALGVFASALASWSAAQEALGQNRRNAERYQRTAQTLSVLARELDRVRRAAYEGNRKAVALFVEAVNNELSLEHRQWLEDIEGANKAIVRLRESLKEAEEGEGTPAPA